MIIRLSVSDIVSLSQSLVTVKPFATVVSVIVVSMLRSVAKFVIVKDTVISLPFSSNVSGIFVHSVGMVIFSVVSV